MKRPLVQEKKALVTGCSSGIGLATARLLRERGWQVLPTARKPEDLEMLRAEGFTPLRLDVSEEPSVTAAAGEALRLFGGRIGALVNNAGFGQAGAVEDLTRATLEYQMGVNFIGAHDLATRFIPAMRRQGWGRIVNVSSVLGRVVLPFYGSYSASKFAMEALTDAMRIELRRSGIGVSLIEPGPIQTEFRANAAERAQSTMLGAGRVFEKYYEGEIRRRIAQQEKPHPFTAPPVAVARKILHALESASPGRRYCVTLPAYLGGLAARFAPPALVDWISARKLPGA